MIEHAHEVLDTIRKDGEVDANVIRIKDTGAADTNYLFNHGLGRIPIGCQVILSSVDCAVYKGDRWDIQAVDLKFTTANADVNIRIW